MKRWILYLLFIMSTTCVSSAYASTLKVITTTEDLAGITKDIGRDYVEVFSLSRGNENPHYVPPKPSFLLKLRDADLLIAVGLELESGWLPALVQKSRNPKIIEGSGYLDASQGAIELLEKREKADRSEGDTHPQGNPHYWLDPKNAHGMVRHIAQKLSELLPAQKDYFEAGSKAFSKELSEREKTWDRIAQKFHGAKIVTYHKSWSYFAKRFGLKVVGTIEPKPGIPPSPAHLFDLQNVIRKTNARLIIVEPYFDSKLPTAVGGQTGIPVVILPTSTGGVKGADQYFDLIDYNLNQIQKVLQ